MTTIIYAVHEQVAKDKVILMPATDLTPSYMIFHSQIEAIVLAGATGSTLVHIRDLFPESKDYTKESQGESIS